MKRTGIACLISSMFGMGCAVGAPGGDEAIGVAEDAYVAQNALVPNALVPNALVPNALVPNALVPNALTFTSLSQASQTAITDPGPAGDLSRSFLKYAVSCAFAPNQSFSFSWTGSDQSQHSENYEGELGLATGWEDGPLSDTEKAWVSACLASRANYYGVSVTISMRGPHSNLSAGLTEQLAYPTREGAFWGNLFASTPALYACHIGSNIDFSRSRMRDCAAGHLEDEVITPCGMIQIVGDCRDVCDTNLLGIGAYPSCGSNPQAITTYLQ